MTTNAVRDGCLFLAAVFSGCVLMAWMTVHIRWGLTPSLPEGLYLRSRGEVELGAVVESCVGGHASVIAERDYLPEGFCPSGTAVVMKRVAAVAGDVVEVRPDGLYRDGEWLAPPLESHDSKGREVPRVKVGVYPVEGNDIWILGEHRRSLDSRMFGPVDRRQVFCCYRLAWTP